MHLSTKIIGMVVAAVIVASVVSDRLASRDPVLSGAKEFATNAPEVVAVAGFVESVRTVRFLNYYGVPGKEEPYRQYQLSVAGSKASINVTVRATSSQPKGIWSYKVASIGQ